MDFETTPEPIRRRSPLTKIGWSIAAFAFVLAFAANGVLAQGAGRFEDAAAVTHRIALLIMLVGMITAMIGHRIDWFASRSPPRPPEPIPLAEPIPLPASSPSPWGAVAQWSEQVVDAEVADERLSASNEPATEAELSPSPRRELVSAELRFDRGALLAIAFVFGLTFVTTAFEAILLLAPAALSFPVAMVTIFALNVVVALAAFLGRSYLRAFAFGAWLPALGLLLALPLLLERLFLPVRTFGMNEADHDMAMNVAIGAMLVVPGGMLGTLVLVVTRSLNSVPVARGG